MTRPEGFRIGRTLLDSWLTGAVQRAGFAMRGVGLPASGAIPAGRAAFDVAAKAAPRGGTR